MQYFSFFIELKNKSTFFSSVLLISLFIFCLIQIKYINNLIIVKKNLNIGFLI